MKSALLGHSGFVGSNLMSQFPFTHHFNSKNISDFPAHFYDLVVCAAIPAAKWIANRDPEADKANITSLLSVLSRTTARRFVLISTVDVYPHPVQVDEQYEVTHLENHAYGKHRAEVESFVSKTFAHHQILRLPGLFGPGLKKNVIFDLLHSNNLAQINPESIFQYYSLSRLWTDIEKAQTLGLRILNLATEPIQTRTLVKRFFPAHRIGEAPSPRAAYDYRSCHAEKWGGQDGYLYTADTVLQDLALFLRNCG